jgi:predicted nucleic acid-binding Zn ribbon protein
VNEEDESKRHEIATPVWTEEQLKRRRQRNMAIAWTLAALIVLFFVVTIVKLGGNVANRPL